MKGKNKGKSCSLLMMILALFVLCGCEGKYGDIYIEESSYESRQLIEGWLAYKAQMEDTSKLADEAVAQQPKETVKKQEEQTSQEVTENQQETEVQEKKPYVQTEAQLAVEGAVVQPLTEHGFYYGNLSDSLKKVYDEMLDSMLQMKQVTISTLSEEQADFAFQCVLFDHPEIFYVSGYHIIKKTMDGSTIELSFYGEYTLSKEEILERQKQIETYADTFCSTLWDGMDEYEKVKAVYDYLITNTTYNLEAPDNQNICSVFVNGQSVCQGYAEATQYLLQKLGMEAAVVSGKVNEGNRHAWNLVKVNGAYYYIDTTWGDADYRIIDENGEVAEEHLSSINYDYFLVTTSQLEKTHQIEAVITMPVCTATADNYYVREGLYFESVDENQIAEAFRKAYESGRGTVTLKASNDEVYAALKEYMITNQKVFQYMDSSSIISYSEDARMGTLCFWL